MISRHRKRNTWSEKVDHFIATTEFAKAQFVQAGINAACITVKPHFLPYAATGPRKLSSFPNALFVGRLSVEKGIETLLEAWENLSVPLDIIGDGPLFPLCAPKCSLNIRMIGRLDSSAVLKRMSEASFLVMTSGYYETFGLVLIEAFSQGLPVIASRLGAMKEIIEEGVTGLLFEPGNSSDLAAKALWAAEHPANMAKMGENARKVFLEKYTPEVNYRLLAGIYENISRRMHHA